MGKEKRIKKWKSSRVLAEVYLEDMAEQGLILEGMTALQYIFREDEPQYLCYRIEEREHLLTDEERAEYAKEGWQEVCRHELEYVFARENSADESEEQQEAVQEHLEVQMEAERKRLRSMGRRLLVIAVIAVLVFLVLFGTGQGESLPKEATDWMAKGASRFVKIALLALGAGCLKLRDLRKKKEQAEDGYIPEAYTDRPMGCSIVLCILLVGAIGLALWMVAKGGSLK